MPRVIKTSTAMKLTNILLSILPRTINTGLTKDLGTVHPNLKSKGKAVDFTWRYSRFRLTANLKVQEYNFMNQPKPSETALETENMIRSAVKA